MLWNNPNFNIHLRKTATIPLKAIEAFINSQPSKRTDIIKQRVNVLMHKGRAAEAIALAVTSPEYPIRDLPFKLDYIVVNTGFRVDREYVEASTFDILQHIKNSSATHIVLLGDDVLQHSAIGKILRACDYADKKIIILYTLCQNIPAIPPDLARRIELIGIYKPSFSQRKYLRFLKTKNAIRIYPTKPAIKTCTKRKFNLFKIFNVK